MVTRRTFLASALPVAVAAQQRRPNIVMILADDLGYECLSCYGSTSYRTPHLDRLAGSGIRFTHAYAQPLCTPTRVQLMTGQYNFRNWKGFGIMDPKEQTFGHWMTGAGYRTAIAGKWQFWSYNPPDFEPEYRGKGQHPRDCGFEEHCLWHPEHTEDKGSRYGDPTYMVNGQLHKEEKGRYGPDIYADFLMNFMERRKSEPFFAYYPMALTHGPFNPTPKSKGWDAARLKNDRGHFKDMVEYMDEVVGRLVRKTDELGIRDNTLFLFFGDNGTDKSITSMLHGKPIQGGKGLPTDAGTRVPMIAQWQGVTPRGRVLDDLIDSTDFWPTIAEAAGVRPPAGVPVDGRSFLPQIRGRKGKPREFAFCHHDPRPGWAKAEYRLERWARTQRYKLYEDNRLYDIPADTLEKSPLDPALEPSSARQARRRLRAALDRLHA